MNIQYSFNDTFKWGYGNEWFNIPQGKETFKLQLYSPIGEVLSIREEFSRIAKLLLDQFQDERLLVHFSGGFDSQALVLSLLNYTRDFDLIFRANYYHDVFVNDDELDNVKAFCNRYRLDFKIHRVDIDQRLDFYKSLSREYYYLPIWSSYLTLDLALQNPNRIQLISYDDGVFRPKINSHDHLKKIITEYGIDNQILWDYYNSRTLHHLESDGLDSTFTVDLQGYFKALELPCIQNVMLYHPNLRYAYINHPFNRWYRQRKTQLLSTFMDHVSESYRTQDFYSAMIKPLVFKEAYGDAIFNTIKRNGVDKMVPDTLISHEFIRDCFEEDFQYVINVKGKSIDYLTTLDNIKQTFYSRESNA